MLIQNCLPKQLCAPSCPPAAADRDSSLSGASSTVSGDSLVSGCFELRRDHPCRCVIVGVTHHIALLDPRLVLVLELVCCTLHPLLLEEGINPSKPSIPSVRRTT